MTTEHASDPTAQPFGHDLEACRAVVRDLMADMGCEVTVSTAPPLIHTAYDPNPMTCPHGVTFYMAPTSDQILAWRRDSVR